uniref:Prenyl transferase n=1 Tax=Cyanidium sp. THAL103 TaxID=3027999 RepID=A0A9Y1I3Z3_9RHOD|nr:prenyl transferase [Cyanidium sp. THAL103]
MNLSQSYKNIIDTELEKLNINLKKLIIAKQPMLKAASEYMFLKKGKKIRPIIVLLVSKIVNLNSKINSAQQRLAEITEIIHTATLLHDDVVDESILRRGSSTVNKIYNNQIAILAGDFLFAQSSWYIANINNLQVVKNISKVIKDLAEGEISQNSNKFNNQLSITDYLEKSFYKTASLIAASSNSAAILGESNIVVNRQFYNYGKNIGLAFQIIDDILDINSSPKILGKPIGIDLQAGNLTAPILFALTRNSILLEIINREFYQKDDVLKAKNLILYSDAVQESLDLAFEHIQAAINSIKDIPESFAKNSLIKISYSIIEECQFN